MAVVGSTDGGTFDDSIAIVGTDTVGSCVCSIEVISEPVVECVVREISV